MEIDSAMSCAKVSMKTTEITKYKKEHKTRQGIEVFDLLNSVTYNSAISDFQQLR